MKFPTLFLVICPLVLTSTVPVSAETVEDLIAEGHSHARRYQEEKALKCFLEAAKHDRENVTVLVAISREYRHLMSDATSRNARLRHGNTALRYALQAAKLGPDDAEAQLAPAITYGKMLPLIDDSGEKLGLSRKIKAAADRALALDPGNDIGWHILGCWHRGFAEISGVKRMVGGLVHGKIPESTYGDAVACFRKAIELNPNRLMHQIELGCTYCAMGKPELGRKLISRGLQMRETEKDDPETKRRGREILRTAAR